MKRILLIACVLVSGISVFYSCKKSDAVGPMRMLMPGADIKATSNSTNVILSWTASVNTDSTLKNVDYYIEVSEDSTFSKIIYATTTKDFSTTINDDVLLPKKKYVARLQVKGVDSRPDSKWLISNTFSITGENLFLPQHAGDVGYYKSILRWQHQDGLTKITVTTNGVSVDYPVTADTILLANLTANTSYSAELFKGAASKGTTTFATKDLGNFTLIISSSDTLNKVIDTCSNGAVIGLQPGVYNCVDATGAAANITILKKNVTIGSISGNPGDTKVNYKEITLKGDGAGVKLAGINFDGSSASAAYFINLIGETANSAAASFASITVDGCNITGASNCLVRASQGTAAGTQKMQAITFNNCFANVNSSVSTSYSCFMMDKMQFASLTMTNSTFINFGRGLISYATAMTGVPNPVINIDRCTMNNFGSGAKYAVLDASTSNAVIFTLTNCIMANGPMSGSTVANAALRYASSSQATVSNFNVFKLTNGATTPVDLTWLTGTPQKIDLGWTSSTVTFTLPVGSTLRTAALDGGAIGDPRWVN